MNAISSYLFLSNSRNGTVPTQYRSNIHREAMVYPLKVEIKVEEDESIDESIDYQIHEFESDDSWGSDSGSNPSSINDVENSNQPGTKKAAYDLSLELAFLEKMHQNKAFVRVDRSLFAKKLDGSVFFVHHRINKDYFKCKSAELKIDSCLADFQDHMQSRPEKLSKSFFMSIFQTLASLLWEKTRVLFPITMAKVNRMIFIDKFIQYHEKLRPFLDQFVSRCHDDPCVSNLQCFDVSPNSFFLRK